MRREYVFEGDYGLRTPVKEALKIVLDKQGAEILTMAAVFVNNNPYQLEIYLVMDYSQLASENDVEYMKSILKNANMVERVDLTYDYLFMEMTKKRFNFVQFIDADDVDIHFDFAFVFDEAEKMESKGFCGSKEQKNKVFISHASKDTDSVKKIIPYLNARGVSVWFDELSISFGDSITDKIQEGIVESNMAVFWVTKAFIDSNWCRQEMKSFIKKMVESNAILLCVLADDVQKDCLPEFLQDRKYIRVNGRPTSEVAQDIISGIEKKAHFS